MTASLQVAAARVYCRRSARGSLRPVGAVWVRLLVGAQKGFAHLDDETWEMGVALLPGHRGRGVGTALLEHVIEAARPSYPALALSVSAHNPAKSLYERLGFEVVEVREADHPVTGLEPGGRLME